jgi:hypothetical protein
MNTTAIAAAAPRQRTRVRGEVVSVVSYGQPSIRTDAEVTDGTGCLLLRFVGRSTIPGLVVGCRIVAEGTPGLVRGALVMLNPLYSLKGTGDRPPPTGSRCPGRS